MAGLAPCPTRTPHLAAGLEARGVTCSLLMPLSESSAAAPLTVRPGSLDAEGFQLFSEPLCRPCHPPWGVHQHLRPGHPPGNTLAALLEAHLWGPQQPAASDRLGTEQPGAPGSGLLPPTRRPRWSPHNQALCGGPSGRLEAEHKGPMLYDQSSKRCLQKSTEDEGITVPYPGCGTGQLLAAPARPEASANGPAVC